MHFTVSGTDILVVRYTELKEWLACRTSVANRQTFDRAEAECYTQHRDSALLTSVSYSPRTGWRWRLRRRWLWWRSPSGWGSKERVFSATALKQASFVFPLHSHFLSVSFWLFFSFACSYTFSITLVFNLKIKGLQVLKKCNSSVQIICSQSEIK